MDKKELINNIKGTVITVAIALAFSFLFTEVIAVRAIVQGDSMYPTLVDQQSIIASKIIYKISEPKRFDIIVANDLQIPDTVIIKRIIGLPGETVTIDIEGNIYINGKQLEDIDNLEKISDPGLALEGVTLGENEYFVMGDNRNNSLDSRSVVIGNIKRDSIFAKAIELNLFNK